MKTIIAFAPATVANLSCGFDALGMTLHSIGDKVELSLSDKEITTITEQRNANGIPYDITKNSVGVVLTAMQKELKDSTPFNIRIEKGFQSGSGLGSSSASSAAAAFAYNEWMGKPFTEHQLVEFAMKGEEAACGTLHADNVSAALLGGIVLIRGYEPLELVKLPVPQELFAVILFPQVKINTADARGILPRQLPMKDAITQWANLAGFVSALYTSDFGLMKRSMKDLAAEPVRKLLIPKFEEMQTAALSAGAVSFGISGSGPSVFAIAKGEKAAGKILQAVKEVFEGTAIDTIGFTEQITSGSGARLVDSF